MRLFLSYRRDDTGGRAGRLFDTLVSQYGRDRVFHDVNTVEPGLKFVQQVEVAIRRSDVVLVVIGPGWLSSPAPDGGRRIDQADDFVRRELSVALESNVRLVPVLVDGATLPLAGDLPDALVPMLERHAVSIRDVSWHQDVDDLIKRLEGEPRESGPPRDRRMWVGGIAAGVVLVAGLAVVATRGGNEGSTWVEPPPCPDPVPSWTTLPLVAEPTLEFTEDGSVVEMEVQRAAIEPRSDGTTLVVIELRVADITEPSEADTEPGFYYTYATFDGLLVGGVAHTKVACANTFSGDPQLEPGEVVRGRIGYETDDDPSSVALALERDDGLVPIYAP